ncbi:MAG TPA: hypothetical protein VN764_01320, partial [Polyangiaceae bacterium]|nr:hypothetical protein [Polyangiaceae bacterium]
MTTPNDAPLSSLSKAYGPIAVAVFLIGWLKGFRLPNLWSATHFAFNYSQGFVRRGFVGELARLVGGEKVYTYQNFLVFSVVVFLVTATLLTITIRRTLDASPRDLPLRAAVLVFAASPGL